MNMSLAFVPAPTRGILHGRFRGLVPFTLALGMAGLGCFRATGISRPDTVVEEIPASGGDRVVGLKATSGPGDFFLGNDSVEMAVDGAAFGDRGGQFGAPSGGAVLDIGTIALDQSFHRVSMPTDMLERLGPVANQDPDLPLVFDQYTPGNGVNSVNLGMQGYLLDPKGKLGVTPDAQGRVPGVTVSHQITLNQGQLFFTLVTTLTNGSGTTLPVQSLGDYLSQHGGGFRFVVPAVADFNGNALPTAWGVEIPQWTDFTGTNALQTSVQTPMVGLMGAESAGSTYDSHASLGILPLDGGMLLVASDPQHALTENHPVFPGRLVVGSLPPSGTMPGQPSLAPGQSIIYRRRLYIIGGPSSSSSWPAETTFVFSLMAQDQAGLLGGNVGFLSFNSFGTAALGGPLQTEFRFERYTYKGLNPSDPSNLANAANWRLERVEWREPTETGASNGPGMFLPVIPDPNNPAVGSRYRLIARNANQQSDPLYLGTNVYANLANPALSSQTSYIPTPIIPSVTQVWQVAEALSPERADVIDAAGNVVRSLQTAHGFSARQAGTLEYGGLNPLRLTFLGVGNADPSMQRSRMLSSIYSQIYKAKATVGSSYGAYHYTAGNQIFGTAFAATLSSSSAAVMYFPPGNYLAYATRGPLSQLNSLPVSAFDGQTNVSHAFVVSPPTLPVGWTSFDLPAPTQATTGGYNPGEMLSSAVSEGIQVVARTEEDLLTDAVALQAEFRAEIDNNFVSDAQRAPLGNDPFVVGARSSSLADGFTTALFTPTPTTDRNGGARPSSGWNLADFITQAEGAYNVVHRPCGPSGLFTVRGFDRTVPLGSGVNAWWNQTGPASLGKHMGDFDALELLRAEGCNPADPTAWYAEFSTVRDDWFAILNQQQPAAFTKGLGLSAARFSLDTPVGLARTYLNLGAAAAATLQTNLSLVGTALQNSTAVPYGTISEPMMTSVLAALKNGAAVASTGPLLDVSVGGVGPGGLVAGPNSSVNLVINLYAPDWVPVDEVRVVVNGAAPIQVPMASFTASSSDYRLRTATVTVPMPVGKDAWLVVEAGVSRSQTGPYLAGTPWNKIMKGIYPIAITNPIFVDVNGGGYSPPGL
jgi:hypothetical protein